ncbi:MAG: hypothetical protein E7252_07010 [Lachnospira sp.]|nr:hypothetical protein [Lachnospira sp.]
MKNRILKIFFAIVLSINIIIISTHNIYAAKQDDNPEQIYQYWYKNPLVAAINTRVWISDLNKNFTNTKISFDAKSFSDVYVVDKEYRITDHKNSLIIDTTRIDGELTVGNTGVGVTVGDNNRNYTFTTAANSNAHTSICAYNNTIRAGMFGTLAGILGLPVNIINHGIIDVTSTQSVYINGNLYNNLAEVRVYY